jgi:predicted AlkP superfamily pyrophosphatase or phosphodiesterase
MRTFAKISVVVFLIILISFSCKDEPLEPRYLTENVIVIVIDGPRYSETWGDSSHQNIPRLSNQLSKLGVINTQFYNDGPTYTLAGHTSITTGNYQEIDNSGNVFIKIRNNQIAEALEIIREERKNLNLTKPLDSC